jgi:transposase-like protein
MMPPKRKFWTEEMKRKVVNLCQVHNGDYEKVCKELGLDKNYLQEIKQKHAELTVNKNIKSMERIKKILKK